MTQAATDTSAPSPFWTFSLSVYGRKGVPPACLTLQDRSGVDVNVLLFCLYLGSRSRALSPSDVAGIRDAVEPWRRDVVVEIRQARRALKEPPAPFAGAAVEALRKAVKAAELEAERIQQETLFVNFGVQAIGAEAPDAAAACAGNIEAYRHLLGADFDAAAVATLLAAVAQVTSTPREKSQ